MVSNDVVMQTVRRMVSSGVDDETIRITLRGINISDAEINSIISQAKGTSSAEPAQSQERVSQENEAEEQEDVQAVEEGDEEFGEGGLGGDVDEKIEASHEEQLANHAATHAVLESQNVKMDEMHQDISRLNQKIDSPQFAASELTARIKAVDIRISSLEKEIAETKANTIALQDILKKILETDRKTLSELQKK